MTDIILNSKIIILLLFYSYAFGGTEGVQCMQKEYVLYAHVNDEQNG